MVIFLVFLAVLLIVGLWMFDDNMGALLFLPIIILICGLAIGVLHSKQIIKGKFVPDGWYTIHHNLILSPVENDFWGILSEEYKPKRMRTQWIVIESYNDYNDTMQYILRLEQKEPLPFGTKTVLKAGKRFIPAVPPPQITLDEIVEEVKEKSSTQ
ncbi:MAG: hypothetical protein KAR00_00930 [Candidatus Pacebacteria bacterium]|nr:hypothetical protein [Candidatus Paceibacterota bacterium]